MQDDGVRIYNAAKFTSPPKSLREVLDFVAVECVFYEHEKQKKGRLQRLRHKLKINKIRRGKRKNSKETDVHYREGDYDSQYGSTAGSTADSTTSSLTMPTLIGDKSAAGEITNNSPYSKPGVPTTNNDKGPSIENSFTRLDAKKMLFFNSEMEADEDDRELSNLGEAGLSILTMSSDEVESENEIDGMTVSTFALVGDNEHELKSRPVIIFTQADDERSTKWWYENDDENTEEKEEGTNLQPVCCGENIDTLLINTNLLLCPARNNLDVIDKNDLELEVEHIDPMSTSKTEDYFINGSNGHSFAKDTAIQLKISEINDFLKSNELEDTDGKTEFSKLSFVMQQEGQEEGLGVLEDTVGASQKEVEQYTKENVVLNGDKSTMLSINDRRQKILHLKNAQMVKYEVVLSILEDEMYDEEAKYRLNKLMARICCLEQEIKELDTPNLIGECCDDLFGDFDDSIREIDTKIRSKKASVERLMSELETDQF